MELWKTPVLQLSWQNKLQLLPSLQEVAQLLAACRLSLAALGWLAPHLDPPVAPPHNLAVAQLVLPAAVAAVFAAAAADSLLELLPPSLVLYVAEVCTAVGRTALAVGTVVVAVGTAVATASDIAVVVDIPPAVVVVHNLAAPAPELLPVYVAVVA